MRMKVLITAPSLDENRNVSGISTVVRQIIENGAAHYEHFSAGRQDGARTSAPWILKQIFLPALFFQTIRRRKIDIVHVNTAFNPLSIVRDYALVKAARAARRPVLLHVHGGRFLAEEFRSVWLKKIAEKTLRSASVVVVLSELEKQIVEQRWRDLEVRVLQNAVAIETPAEKRIETEEKTLLFLGRFHESKGLHEIIEACRRLRDENFRFRFNAFGTGEMKDLFVGEMTAILGERFFYGGVIKGAEKWRRLAESDVFLLPSRYGEGLPMALLEAMAAGCVPIASEMASIGAVVRSGNNGFTIKPGDVSQLVEKLKMLLSNEVDWDALRRNARAAVEENFNLRDYTEKLKNIYREIVSDERN